MGKDKLNKTYEDLLLSEKLGDDEKSYSIKWDMVLNYMKRSKIDFKDEDSKSEYILRLFDIIDKFRDSQTKQSFNNYFAVNAYYLRKKIENDLDKEEASGEDVVSLDAVSGLGNEDCIEEVIKNDFLKNKVYADLARLSPRSFLVKAYHYGLFCRDTPMSQRNIAYAFGISNTRADILLKRDLKLLTRAAAEGGHIPNRNDRSGAFLELLQARDKTTNIPLTQHSIALFGIKPNYNNEDSTSFEKRQNHDSSVVDRTRILTDCKGNDILTLEQLTDCVKNREDILTRERTEEDSALLEEVYKRNLGKVIDDDSKDEIDSKNNESEETDNYEQPLIN